MLVAFTSKLDFGWYDVGEERKQIRLHSSLGYRPPVPEAIQLVLIAATDEASLTPKTLTFLGGTITGGWTSVAHRVYLNACYNYLATWFAISGGNQLRELLLPSGISECLEAAEGRLDRQFGKTTYRKAVQMFRNKIVVHPSENALRPVKGYRLAFGHGSRPPPGDCFVGSAPRNDASRRVPER